MKKFLFKLLFLFAVSLAVGYGYLWFQSSMAIERFQHLMAQYANIQYQRLTVSPSGVIVLEQVQITPFLLRRSYQAEQVVLEFGGLPDMVSGLGDWLGNSLPMRLHVKLLGVTGELRGRDPEELLASLYSPSFLKPLGLYACGDASRVGHDQLREMGVDGLNMDLLLDYRFDQDTSKLNLSGEVDGGELGKFSLAADIGGLTRQLGKGSSSDAAAKQAGQAPLETLKIEHAEMAYQDGGYFRRLGFFCSEKSATQREQYAIMAAREWRRVMADELHMQMNDTLASVYALFLRDGGKLSVSLDPERPVTLDSLAKLQHSNYADFLDLAVDINGRMVNQLFLAYQPPAPVVEEPIEPSPGPDEKEQKPAFKETLFEELQAYIGRPVKLWLNNDKFHEGKLDEVGGAGLQITKLVSGGIVAFQFDSQDIQRIEVLRK